MTSPHAYERGFNYAGQCGLAGLANNRGESPAIPMSYAAGLAAHALEKSLADSDPDEDLHSQSAALRAQSDGPR